MKRWGADTLGTRLFLLMWVALVVSHLVAFSTVRGLMAPGPGGGPVPPMAEGGRPPGHHARREPRGQAPPLPTFPSLPPTPGLPMAAPRAPALPWAALALDYGVRLLIIAAAAWWGSRWLARPVKRLVQASAALAPALARGTTPTRLDERRGTREVRDAAAVFNGMAAQMARQFEARGLMIAAISHDLRTPLTRIRMRLETSDAPSELRQRCVADIREMNALIDTVLDVFRGADGATAVARVDVAALVQALVDDRAELGASLTFHGRRAVARVDSVALRRLVGNLIDNALRYAGTAEVSVHEDNAGCHVLVQDRGPGIPADQLAAVLQPFYRVDASRNRETGGSGLGLFIAKELAERQGGRLELQNREGGGLSAEVVLPREP